MGNAFDQLNAQLDKLGAHNICLIKNVHTDPNHFVFRTADYAVDSITLLGRNLSASALVEYFQRRCPLARLDFYAYSFGGKKPRLVHSSSQIIGNTRSENSVTYPRYSELVESIGGW